LKFHFQPGFSNTAISIMINNHYSKIANVKKRQKD
jgi:hypothetical protein